MRTGQERSVVCRKEQVVKEERRMLARRPSTLTQRSTSVIFRAIYLNTTHTTHSAHTTR